MNTDGLETVEQLVTRANKLRDTTYLIPMSKEQKLQNLKEAKRLFQKALILSYSDDISKLIDIISSEIEVIREEIGTNQIIFILNNLRYIVFSVLIVIVLVLHQDFMSWIRQAVNLINRPDLSLPLQNFANVFTIILGVGVIGDVFYSFARSRRKTKSKENAHVHH